MTFTMQMEVVTSEGDHAYSLNADQTLSGIISQISTQILHDCGLDSPPAAVTIIIQGSPAHGPA